MSLLMSLSSGSDLVETLRALSEQPYLLAALIVFATFILEDAATIAAALLAAQGFIDPSLSLGALFVGIVLGDIGLYVLGRYAANHPWVLRWFGEKRLKRGRDWMHHRLAPALIGARFIPGMRLPTYIASGLLKVSFIRFTMIAIVAVGIWTSLFFAAVYYFGSIIIDTLGEWTWLIGLALVLIAIFLPKRLASDSGDDEADEAKEDSPKS